MTLNDTSSNYVVTARKWRPITFEEVIGQQHVCSTLKNSLKKGRIGHAYIFSGPRGVGKTSVARILARVLNCNQNADGNPCNKCESCSEISGGRYLDVFEIDGASNRGIEEIRNLRESVRYSPGKGKVKIYIIDEVHMLTKEAFNALLKTLEEPPSHVLFIFATTEVHKVPPTILSRCQRFDFKRIATSDIISQLQQIAKSENINIDDDALLTIAKKGDGSMRDAQSIFDQVVAYAGSEISGETVLETLNVVDEELYFEFSSLVRNRDTRSGIMLVARIVEKGYDLREFVSGLVEHFRNLLIVVTTGSTELIETSVEYKKKYIKEAESFSGTDLLRYIRAIMELENEMKWSTQPRLRLESGIVTIINMESAENLSSLLKKLENLKKNNNTEVQIPIVGSAQAGWSADSSTAISSSPPDVSEDRKTISADEIFTRWHEFTNMVKSERINLGSILTQSKLADAGNGIIKLRCLNEYQLNAVKKNGTYLSEVSRKVFGTAGRFEVEIAPENSNQPDKKEHDHPVIEALKRELGAEPL